MIGEKAEFVKPYPYTRIKALINSINGIKALWSKEISFRQEVYLMTVLAPIIIWMHVPALLKLFLGMLLLFLLAVEAINSAIEAVVDRISLEIHPQSKIAKDIGSAAVAIVIMMNAIAWIYTLFVVL